MNRNQYILYEGKVVVKKWGNSQGIRIPKEILGSISISEGDTLQLYVDNNTNSIILKNPQKKLRLEERLSCFTINQLMKFYTWKRKRLSGELRKAMKNGKTHI